MAEIIWTHSAARSLNDVAEYIAIENPAAARALVKDVFSVVERLDTFPMSGRVVPEIPDLPYREVICNPCRVLYKYDEGACCVYMIGVMRQEQALLNFFDNFKE